MRIEMARGIGHAMNYLSISKAVRSRGGAVHFSVEGADDLIAVIEEHGVKCDVTTDHGEVIELFDPDIIGPA